MALGAQRRDVIGLIVKQGVVVAVTGITVGLIASFGLTRLIASLLFGVTATDARTFAMVASGLFIVALVASFIPAHRATKIDPLVVLRYE